MPIVYRGSYAPDVRLSKKVGYENIIKDLSNVTGDAESYEFVSVHRGVVSKRILSDLSELEKIVLAVYGKFGLVMNKVLRAYRHLPSDYMSLRDSERYLRRSHRRLGIKDYTDIINVNEYNKKIFTRHWSDADYSAPMYEAYRSIIDNIMQRHRWTHPHRLYRIGRAKRNTYVNTPLEAHDERAAITPGSVVQDYGFASSSTDGRAAIFRYSTHGQSASNRKELADDEEEILYVINDEEGHLRAIDISGFKFGPHFKRLRTSSGEFLVNSNTTFRVQGFQNTEPNMRRRIVFLKPIVSPNPDEFVHDPYNGERLRHWPPLPGAAGNPQNPIE